MASAKKFLEHEVGIIAIIMCSGHSKAVVAQPCGACLSLAPKLMTHLQQSGITVAVPAAKAGKEKK